jgi:hypothetical protein
MGASGWAYWTAYTPDVASALQDLREATFKARDYFGQEEEEPSSIAEVLDRNDEMGTHSILDISEATESFSDGSVWPLTREEQLSVFATLTPTHQEIESKEDLLYSLVEERWTGRYLIAYKDGTPAEYFFTGISGD